MNDLSRRIPTRASGFTLIELLVAVAILGLLFAVAFGSLSIGARSWERGIARADDNQDLRRSIDFLRRQFAQLTPLADNGGRERRIAFAGSADIARFVAPAPESVATGFVVVTLGIDRRGTDVSMWFAVAPLDPGAQSEFAGAIPWRRTLFAELADATISYFGAPFDDGVSNWHREWNTNATRFPAIVRIASVGADGTRRPELLFRIRAQEPT